VTCALVQISQELLGHPFVLAAAPAGIVLALGLTERRRAFAIASVPDAAATRAILRPEQPSRTARGMHVG
jgi:hypothetical protein